MTFQAKSCRITNVSSGVLLQREQIPGELMQMTMIAMEERKIIETFRISGGSGREKS